MLVVVITWRYSGDLRTEAFGPWAAEDDGGHMDKIAAFLRRWNAQAKATDNVKFVNAMLHLVTPVSQDDGA